mgnify:CR=1 FL=1
MKQKLNFSAKKWRLEVGEDLSYLDKKYKNIDWIFEEMGLRKHERRKE